MARDTLFHHPKFLRLVHLLGEPEPHVLGYLEFLWHTAYQSGDPRIGDVLDVELAAKYPGERGKLCRALLTVRLIDAVGDDQYQVHDLFDNAPDHVQRRAEREAGRRAKGKSISDLRSEAGKKGAASRWGASAGEPAPDACHPADGKRMANGDACHPADGKRMANGATPSPTPSNTPPYPPSQGGCGDKPPGRAQKGKPAEPAEPEGFVAFMEVYPRHDRRGRALTAWQALAPDAALAAAIIDALRNQKTSGRRKAGDWPPAHEWLSAKEWEAKDPGAAMRDLRQKDAEARAKAAPLPPDWRKK